MTVSGTHDASLVILSILIAIAASYTALDLAGRAIVSARGARSHWLVGAAFTMGGGIWAMHFVAMLAYRMPGMAVSYEIWPTLLSLAVAVGATWAGFRVMSFAPGSPALLVGAGTFTGLGIVAMHYLGMTAMRMRASVSYEPGWVVISVGVAVAAATAALWLSLRKNGPLERLGASLVMGAAVSGMHYSAMRGASFVSSDGAGHSGSLGQTGLALGVAAAAFSIVMIALAVSVFDRRLADLASREAAALRVSEERHRALYSGTPLPLLALDPQGRVEQASDAWLEMAARSRDEVIGCPVTDFMDRESAARMREEDRDLLIKDGAVVDREHRLVTSTGEAREVLVSARVRRDAGGQVLGVLCGMTDVTERRRAEEGLRQAQKLEAIGQLTGGVAHDFNNLLAVVMGNLDLARRRLASDPRTLRLVENALEGANRGASLTQRLLAFARRQDLNPAAVDVAALVEGMSDLMRRSLGPMIRVEIGFAAGLPPARVDAHQLEMAILNLAVNARDAMPDGGTLAISVDEVPAAEGREGMVRIRVRDDGCGMDAETLARASEPFFTTKGVGKGTGLGLSMAQGLAAQSGGRLTLRSRPGAGTTVELLLPQADTAPRASVPEPEMAAPVDPLSILVVDDDPLVLENTVAMLEDLGHRVASASCGQDALRMVEDGSEPDLLVTDYLMPGMSGAQLAAQLSGSHPWLPVLLASGYSDRLGSDVGHLPLLAKPFGQAALDRAVRATVAEAKVVRFDGRRRLAS